MIVTDLTQYIHQSLNTHQFNLRQYKSSLFLPSHMMAQPPSPPNAGGYYQSRKQRAWPFTVNLLLDSSTKKKYLGSWACTVTVISPSEVANGTALLYTSALEY